MGHKRHLHRMKAVHKKSVRAQNDYKKRMETKKRVAKLTAKRTVEEGHSDEEEKDIRRPITLVRVINEEKIVTKLDDEVWQRVKQLPYVIQIPDSYEQFAKELEDFSPEEVCIYVKRMSDYNSFIADYSKKDRYIELFKYVLQKYDHSVKTLTFEQMNTGLRFIDTYYKLIYAMSSALPETFLEYVRNKLSGYESQKVKQFAKESQFDVFFFVRICCRIMGTEKNLKILQTILMTVNHLLSKVKGNTVSE